MAYLGRQPVLGNFVKLDAISVVNGQAAYTMQNNSVNFTDYSTVNQFLVSLNGTVQSPGSSFTVSSSTITFSSNLSTGDVIDFIIVFGNSLSAGTVADGSITSAKFADSSVTAAKLNDSAVTTTKLNDASVSLAKLTATGTKSSSTFLRGDNTFAEAGGGDFIKLATTTVSSGVNSISFDGIFSSTYSHYQFIGTGLVHNEAWNSSHNGMRMRVRQSDADKTDSNYMWVMNDATIIHSGSTNHSAEGSYSDSRIQITRHQTTGNNFQTSFIVDVHNPLDTAKYKSINWSSSHIYLHDGNSGNRYFHSCPGSAVYRGNTSAYSGVTFFAASGDITAGSISVYGTKL